MFYTVKTEKEAEHCSLMTAKAEHPSLDKNQKLFQGPDTADRKEKNFYDLNIFAVSAVLFACLSGSTGTNTISLTPFSFSFLSMFDIFLISSRNKQWK